MTNKKYTKEFKLDAVQLALTRNDSQAQVTRNLGVNEQSLYNWVNLYRGAPDVSTEQELAALKKEVA